MRQRQPLLSQVEVSMETGQVQLTWGQMRIRDEIIMRGIVLGATTVRNIWIRHNLETRYKRMLELEKRSQGKASSLPGSG